MGSGPSDMGSNRALVDHLVNASHVKKPDVETVLRSVDRAMYMQTTPYKDEAWRLGNLHLSAPCIYGAVLDALELGPGLSFLNLGSGTGYLSTMVGLLIGPNGINHGVEMHSDVIEYAQRKLVEFKQKSFAIDEFDFSEPVFIHGDCLRLKKCRLYDRVYLGACCRPEYENYCKELVKIGGILVMPFNEQLKRYRRRSETVWYEEDLLQVSFAMVAGNSTSPSIQLPDIQPKTLQVLARDYVRQLLRSAIDHNHSDLRHSDNLSERRKRHEASMGDTTKEAAIHEDHLDDGDKNNGENNPSTDRNEEGAGGEEDEDDDDDYNSPSKSSNKRVRSGSLSHDPSAASSAALAAADAASGGSRSDNDNSKRPHDGGAETYEDRFRRIRHHMNNSGGRSISGHGSSSYFNHGHSLSFHSYSRLMRRQLEVRRNRSNNNNNDPNDHVDEANNREDNDDIDYDDDQDEDQNENSSDSGSSSGDEHDIDNNHDQEDDSGSVIVIHSAGAEHDDIDDVENDISEWQQYNIYMRESIKDLALPQTLREFVNYDRDL